MKTEDTLRRANVVVESSTPDSIARLAESHFEIKAQLDELSIALRKVDEELIEAIVKNDEFSLLSVNWRTLYRRYVNPEVR